MNFNSLIFIIFFPVVLLLYWLLPHRFRWILLLAASYYFYMSWNPWLIFLILAITLISYLSGLFISKSEKKAVKKTWLIISIVMSIGSLIFFKYFNFLLQNAINFLNLFSLHIESVSLNIILPIGISFYTFQTLSYVIDIYKGKCEAEKHLGYYALYVCYFPQLVAGPIERPNDLIPQLKMEHKFNKEDVLTGLRIFLVGFFYKCAVADVVGIFVNNVFNDVMNSTTLSIFLAGFLFSVQMYCDFAGYSEIATGCARMMGIKLSRNFNRPYMSKSYSDFFRRWHMTLTSWFTTYVYIPLGGNRKGKVRHIINIFIVFLLCGLWHGANWTYVIWGLYAAFFMSIETLLKKPVTNLLKRKGIDPESKLMISLRVVGMYFILIPAALIFRSRDLIEAGTILGRLFTTWGFTADYFDASMKNLGLSAMFIVLITLLIVGEVYIFHYGELGREQSLDYTKFTRENARSLQVHRYMVALYLILIIAICWIACLGTGASSAFQYFQF